MKKKLLVFFTGLLIIQIGVALFLSAGLGSDPFTVFSQGIANVLHINIGRANQLLTFVLLLLVFCIDRKHINIGTVLTVVFTGFILNYVNVAVDLILPESMNIVQRFLLFIFGCFTVSFGFPLLLSAKLGVAPNDLVYLAISDHFKLPYSKSRMVTDLVFIVVGVLTGGVIGLGTILCIILLGPLTQMFMTPVEGFISQAVLN